MTREKGAGLLLLLLIALSAWNIQKAERLCRDIDAKLCAAEEAAGLNDYESAERAVDAALSLWLDAESYTHIFIRHVEIDACSDIFYEALEAVTAKEPEDTAVSIAKLRYHLESIATMERVSFGSIF